MTEKKDNPKEEKGEYGDFQAIIRKKNGYSIWAERFERLESGNLMVWYTTKEGKAKKVEIAEDQIAEIEESV